MFHFYNSLRRKGIYFLAFKRCDLEVKYIDKAKDLADTVYIIYVLLVMSLFLSAPWNRLPKKWSFGNSRTSSRSHPSTLIVSSCSSPENHNFRLSPFKVRCRQGACRAGADARSDTLSLTDRRPIRADPIGTASGQSVQRSASTLCRQPDSIHFCGIITTNAGSWN